MRNMIVHRTKGENAVSDNPVFLYAGEYESVRWDCLLDERGASHHYKA
jgi:hypothetical protein